MKWWCVCRWVQWVGMCVIKYHQYLWYLPCSCSIKGKNEPQKAHFSYMPKTNRIICRTTEFLYVVEWNYFWWNKTHSDRMMQEVKLSKKESNNRRADTKTKIKVHNTHTNIDCHHQRHQHHLTKNSIDLLSFYSVVLSIACFPSTFSL